MGASTAAAVAGIASAAVSAGTSIYSATKSSKAGNSAANAISGATGDASGTQWGMYNQMRDDTQQYRQLGENAAKLYAANMIPGGDPDAAYSLLEYANYIRNNQLPTFGGITGVEDPSLAFIQDQALKATQRGAAAKTGVLSGATQNALQTNAGNIASTYWQNAYNNALNSYNANQKSFATNASAYGDLANKYSTQRSNYLQQLLAGAQLGENAAVAQGSAGLQTGNQVAQNTLLSGLAQANNAVSQANTAGQTANTLGNSLSSILGQLGNLNFSGGGQTSYYDNALGSYASLPSGSILPTH